jgi:formylglycine-generating enzyme required for sulfatase activity
VILHGAVILRAAVSCRWWLLLCLACGREVPTAEEVSAMASTARDEIVSVASALRPGVMGAVAPSNPKAKEVKQATDAGAPPVITVDELAREVPPDVCPPSMVHVRGGEFWVGSPPGRSAPEERPRFATRVADFCLDRTEVTTDLYAHCVAAGQCSVPHGSRSTCNYGRREQNPVNCVDWNQARDYCTSHGGRLPSEVEWEYAARGGAEYYTFSWGNEPPEGRTCGKSNRSCQVGSFPPGAFGLHDMSGNVSEWTEDWFGDYPWPELDGNSKVFRGGGRSRRSERGLRATLRNRKNPRLWDSHLGFRCARAAKNSECPFGLGTEPGSCLRGVLDVECKDPGERFNGWRCAAPDSPPCPPARTPVPGYGCVSKARARSVAATPSAAPDLTATRVRSPEFDSECRRGEPERPNAYLVEGSTRAGRNRYARVLGCKIRKRGAGWNSACCP